MIRVDQTAAPIEMAPPKARRAVASTAVQASTAVAGHGAGPAASGSVSQAGKAAAKASLIAIRPAGSGVAVRMTKQVALQEAGWLGMGMAAGGGLGAYIARGLGASLKSGSAVKIMVTGVVIGAVIFGIKGWDRIKDQQAKVAP